MNNKKIIIKNWGLIDIIKVFFILVILVILISLGLILLKINYERVIFSYLSYLLLLFLPIIYINKIYGLDIESLGWRPKEFYLKKDIFIGVASGIVLFFLTTGLFSTRQLLTSNYRIIINSERILKLILFIIFSPIVGFLQVIFKPFAEEIFFRGFLLPPLKKSIKKVWLSLTLNGLIFSLLHLDYFRQNSIYLLSSRFIIGTVLAYLYHRYSTLCTCVIAHSTIVILNTGIKIILVTF